MNYILLLANGLSVNLDSCGAKESLVACTRMGELMQSCFAIIYSSKINNGLKQNHINKHEGLIRNPSCFYND